MNAELIVVEILKAFIPLLLAFLSFAVIAKAPLELLKQLKEGLRTIFSDVVFPAFVFLVLFTHKSDLSTSKHALILLVAGFALPLVIVAIGRLLLSLTDGEVKETDLGSLLVTAASTFGGGNRGTVLILVSLPLLDFVRKAIFGAASSAIAVDGFLNAFVILDIGQLLFFAYITDKLYRNKTTSVPADVADSATTLQNASKAGGTTLPTVLLAFLLARLIFDPWLSQLADQTFQKLGDIRGNVSGVFSYLGFVLIFMSMSRSIPDIPAKAFRYGFQAFMARLVGVVIAGVMLYVWVDKSTFGYAIIALSVFVVLPPTSSFDRITKCVEKKFQATNPLPLLNFLILISNLLYLGVLILMVLASAVVLLGRAA